MTSQMDVAWDEFLDTLKVLRNIEPSAEHIQWLQ